MADGGEMNESSTRNHMRLIENIQRKRSIEVLCYQYKIMYKQRRNVQERNYSVGFAEEGVWCCQSS